jgi:hypothetical protein
LAPAGAVSDGLIEGHRSGDALQLELPDPVDPEPYRFDAPDEVLTHEDLVRSRLPK